MPLGRPEVTTPLARRERDQHSGERRITEPRRQRLGPVRA
jgi:hypothetical protein